MDTLSLRDPVVYGPPDISGYVPVPGQMQISYSWGPPDTILGSQVLGYRLEIYLEDDTLFNMYMISYDIFLYTVTDLTTGTSYKASIQAYDPYGEWGQKAFYQSTIPL